MIDLKGVRRRHARAIKTAGSYVRVKGVRGAWYVEFQVDHQYFRVGRDHETKDEADWTRIMLCVAISRLLRK